MWRIWSECSIHVLARCCSRTPHTNSLTCPTCFQFESSLQILLITFNSTNDSSIAHRDLSCKPPVQWLSIRINIEETTLLQFAEGMHQQSRQSKLSFVTLEVSAAYKRILLSHEQGEAKGELMVTQNDRLRASASSPRNTIGIVLSKLQASHASSTLVSKKEQSAGVQPGSRIWQYRMRLEPVSVHPRIPKFLEYLGKIWYDGVYEHGQIISLHAWWKHLPKIDNSLVPFWLPFLAVCPNPFTFSFMVSRATFRALSFPFTANLRSLFPFLLGMARRTVWVLWSFSVYLLFCSDGRPLESRWNRVGVLYAVNLQILCHHLPYRNSAAQWHVFSHLFSWRVLRFWVSPCSVAVWLVLDKVC